MRFSVRLAAISLALSATVSASAATAPAGGQVPPETVRGAVYLPFKAYNAPQMWRDFDAAEANRDMGYARSLHLNAVRIWASYEYWRMDPTGFQTRFDRFLDATQSHGIRVLVSLFENDGLEPTEQHMWDIDPATALDVRSPGSAVAAGTPAGWKDPQRFLTWFMHRYGNDQRLLAIEIMNEPREAGRSDPVTFPFAKAMLGAATAMRGSVPLTVGTDKIEEAATFVPLGIDVIEFHNNFGPSVAEMSANIDQALALGRRTGKPVWLTEWQRVRPNGSGWGTAPVTPAERGPDYASLADTVQSRPIGSFFWSLMVKRAYLGGQRRKGTVNGVFWPDGSVIRLADARALARDPTLELPVKPLPVDWGMEAVAARRR